MKWYKEEFKGRNRITMKQSIQNLAPLNASSAADIAAVQRTYDFSVGIFSSSWTDGNYPLSVRETYGDLLPVLSAENQSMIKGSQDFYAIDPYQTYYVAAYVPHPENPRLLSQSQPKEQPPLTPHTL